MILKDLMDIEDYDLKIKAIEDSQTTKKTPEDNRDYFEGENHPISDREDRVIKNAKGQIIRREEVAKIILDYANVIVESAVAFLFGVPIDFILKESNKDLNEQLEMLKTHLENVKFDSQNKELARALFVETKAAKLYFVKNPKDPEKRKLGCKVLCVKNGDIIYPFFDENGDLKAFLRKYDTKEIYGSRKVVDRAHADIYTEEKIYYATRLATQQKYYVTEEENQFKKIPVVYYEQEKAEWENVKTLMETHEGAFSDLFETNKYFGSPAAKVKGKIKNMPSRDEAGKLFILEPTTVEGKQVYGDIEYMTWDQRPASLQLQFEMTEKFIYSFTNTADISFSNIMANKPGNVSGIALKMLMLAPIIKSYNKQEIFDENLKREFEVIKSIITLIDKKDYSKLKVSIVFNSILPENTKEVVDYLVTATGGKAVMSQETAVQANTLVENKSEEIKKLQKQDEKTESETDEFLFNKAASFVAGQGDITKVNEQGEDTEGSEK